MKSYIRFSVVTFFFIGIIIYIILLNKGYVYKENPPKLTDLLPGTDEGPHQKFRNAESCLVCHSQETDIGFAIAPIIPHEKRENCISCHDLP